MSNPSCNTGTLTPSCSQLTNISRRQLDCEILYFMMRELAAVGGPNYNVDALRVQAESALGAFDLPKLQSAELAICLRNAAAEGVTLPSFQDRQAGAACLLPLDDEVLLRLKTMLMCQLGYHTGMVPDNTIPITIPADPDAAAFVCGWLNVCSLTTGKCTSVNNCGPGVIAPISADCASFCGITQTIVDALQTLVTQLKAAGLWTLMDVIYPFVGGNAGACSLNLKDTTKYAIQWSPSGLSFSLSGVTVTNSVAYGDTTFNPSTAGGNFSLNSASLGLYFESNNPASGWFMGMSTGSGLSPALLSFNNGGVNMVYGVNSLAPSSANNTNTKGSIITSRTGAATEVLYMPDLNTYSSGNASNFLDVDTIAIPGKNNAGLLGSSVVGTYAFGFSGGGLTAGQVTTLQGIITTFQTALGRA